MSREPADRNVRATRFMESLDLHLWTRIGAMNRYDELLLHMQQKFALGKGRFMGRDG